MRKLYISAAMLLGVFAFSSCEDQDTTPVMQEPTEFVLNTPAYVNGTYDLEHSTTLELTCSQPDYGFTAATSYAVEVSLTNVFDGKESVVLGTTYSTARMNVDVAEFAAALTSLATAADPDLTEEDFPMVTEVYVRLVAKLTNSGKGEIASNVIILPNVRMHYALPAVNLPEELYLIGQCNGWDWGAAYAFVPAYDNPNTADKKMFWRLAYLPAEGGLKLNFNKDWDGNEVGYAGVKCVDNASAGVKASDDGNIVVTTGGWYLVVVDMALNGRNYVYNVQFNAPNVYLMGSNAPVNDWSVADANLFSVPADADGSFVSPKFAYDTDGDGGVRACVNIPGHDWWKTEFMVFDGVLKYRATGGDQERVNGKKGQVLKINFTKGTGSIE
jgi:hypothetical protein